MKFDNMPVAAKDGRWISVPVGEFFCTHFDPRSPAYVKVLMRLTRPVKKLVERDLLSTEQDRRFAVEAFVECCVSNWRGVKSDGKDVPYSADLCIELLNQSPPTFYDLVDEAKTLDNFKLPDETAKN